MCIVADSDSLTVEDAGQEDAMDCTPWRLGDKGVFYVQLNYS
jgi:hypothetical protein